MWNRESNSKIESSTDLLWWAVFSVDSNPGLAFWVIFYALGRSKQEDKWLILYMEDRISSQRYENGQPFPKKQSFHVWGVGDICKLLGPQVRLSLFITSKKYFRKRWTPPKLKANGRRSFWETELAQEFEDPPRRFNSACACCWTSG